jgi:hypothetical protein
MFASRRWSPIVAAALAACGGSSVDTSTNDGGGDDSATGDAGAGDSGDIGYLACMSASGQLDDSLKTCQSDTDCVIVREQTDCCGTVLYAGVDAASVMAFDACETSWIAHFPGCGCASGQTTTEDGTVTRPGADAGAPQVHCADFTSNGGICLTFTAP